MVGLIKSIFLKHVFIIQVARWSVCFLFLKLISPLKFLIWLSLFLCSMFPKSTHETFAQKLYQTFKDHKRFIKPKLTRSDFTIVHYAGEVIMVPVFFCAFSCLIIWVSIKLFRFWCTYFQVQYQSDHFLDKNKDYVVPEHQDLLSASKCTFVAGLFPPLTEAAKFSKFSSIGSRFKVSILSLSLSLCFCFILFFSFCYFFYLFLFFCEFYLNNDLRWKVLSSCVVWSTGTVLEG